MWWCRCRGHRQCPQAGASTQRTAEQHVPVPAVTVSPWAPAASASTVEEKLTFCPSAAAVLTVRVF